MKRVICIAIMLLTLVSCNHKELCYHHPHTVSMVVGVDWSEFDKESPTGMTVMVYPQDGSAAIRQRTNTISRAMFELPVGLYNTIVFNQSDEEFGSISFTGMDKFHTAEIVTKIAESRWYESRSQDEKIAMQPEWVGTDVQTDGKVTQEMLNTTSQELMAGAYSRMAPEFLLASHTPLNIIHTVSVKVHLKNIYNLRSARASLTGLADSYSFSDAKTTTAKATQLLESWSITYDEIDPTEGYITATITSLGLPDGHSGDAEDNEFILSLLMVDNSTIIDIPFLVGNKWRRTTNAEGLYLMELNLELDVEDPLPDVQPADSDDGGFDATVDDWGDEENVDIDI